MSVQMRCRWADSAAARKADRWEYRCLADAERPRQVLGEEDIREKRAAAPDNRAAAEDRQPERPAAAVHWPSARDWTRKNIRPEPEKPQATLR